MLDYARISLEPTLTARRTTFHVSSKGPTPVSDEPCEDVALYKKKQEVNISLVGFVSPPQIHVGHSALACQSSAIFKNSSFIALIAINRNTVSIT